MTAAAWWAVPLEALCASLQCSVDGLSTDEATLRRARWGANESAPPSTSTLLSAAWRQLKNPLLLLLVFAVVVSAATGAIVDAVLVGVIVVVSVGVGAVREHRAHTDALALAARVQTRARVVRDGVLVAVPAREVVPGDVLELTAGAIVPADARVVEARHCFVNEAVLTGESFAVEKRPGAAAVDAPLARRAGCVFQGTHVQSGFARVVVVATGAGTAWGHIAERLALRPPETAFDRGLRRFGLLLAQAMLALVVVVLTVNVLLRRPAADTLLFAIALAVGLSPELLPALLSVSLARGATKMAKRGVLVRRLNAIENLGSIDVLCTDKTGTLTEGVVRLQGAWDVDGAPSTSVLALAAQNAALQQGHDNPLDDAILQAHTPELARVKKRAELPWDFVRKRVSVVVDDASSPGAPSSLLITKGAAPGVLRACARTADGRTLDEVLRARLAARIEALAEMGVRVLAVATRTLAPADGAFPGVARDDDDHGLALHGLLTFVDAPKAGVAETLASLAARGVALKMITGDVGGVARHVARQIGLPHARVLTGRDLDELRDEALWHAAERTDLFVEVDPNQKERVILALKKTGHVVGFLGDGINDAPAMHAADTSISVAGAVDVAREAADFVLLQRDLGVLLAGVEEGRRTLANTLKYVLTTTSANLGNMVSMAAVSFALPFLPLTAAQILLNNFLSDIPAIGMADDRVDDEWIARPRRFDAREIGRFMVQFGLLSSIFDGLTFALLLWGVHADEPLFRTAWFVESLLTELVIALVVRTRGPFWRSRPGSFLLWSSCALVVVAFVLPVTPVRHLFGFVPLPPLVVLLLLALTVAYVAAAEGWKRRFFRPR